MVEECFHVFEYEDHLAVFDKEHLTLRLFPPPGALDPPVEDVTESAVARLFGEIPDWKCEPAAPTLDAGPSPPHARVSGRPVLGRLTLTISNVCNMSCSYCYAAGGTYYNTRGLFMSRTTAMNAVNRAARAFSTIHHINFFGGEPTLNRDLIEFVCEYVRYLHQQGVLTSLPSFGITTNGYTIDERMFEILTGYGFSATLSLDGPKEIHDRKRLTKAGKGTHDAIVENIRMLMARGVPVEFECTYSKEHLLQGMDLVGLMDFFYDEFGCRTLHAPFVSVAPDSPEFIPLATCRALQSDAIVYSLRNLRRGIPKSISTATRMLQSLANRVPIQHYCPAGRSAITINADGNTYACFMLMQHAGLSFGNVNVAADKAGVSATGNCGSVIPRKAASASLAIQNGRPALIQQFLDGSDKQRHPACQRCWAQPLCHGCLGEDLERCGPGVQRSHIPGESESCDCKRALAETFLRSVAEAHLASVSPAVG